MMKEKGVILFGAGDMGKKIVKIFKDLDIKVLCFIDSNEKLIKREIMGVEVLNSNKAISLWGVDNYFVITPIARETEKQIRYLLLENGIADNDIVSMEYVIRMKYYRKGGKLEKNLNDKKTWIFDTGETGSFGGIEKYSFMLAKEFIRRGEKTEVIFPSQISYIPEELRNHVINFNFFSREIPTDNFIFLANSLEVGDIDYANRLDEAVGFLLGRMPYVLVLSNMDLWYVAACIINDVFPNINQVISVIHGNEEITKRRNWFAKEDISYWVCSNSGIYYEMAQKYSIPEEKMVIKNHPIIPRENVKVKRYKEGQKLKIGYSGRISKIDKRCDLIPAFVSELNRKLQLFELHILGDGEYKMELQRELEQKGMIEKVFFHEKVLYDKVPEFWEKMDVFINFSETEGMCLSMIEALQSGKPCVSTRIHDDVEKYIVSGKNGYVCEKNDVNGLVDGILKIMEHSDTIYSFGLNSLQIISKSPSIDDYYYFLKDLTEKAQVKNYKYL